MTTRPPRWVQPMLVVALAGIAVPACSDSDTAVSAASAADGDVAAVDHAARTFLLAFDEHDGATFVGSMSPRLCEGDFGEPCADLLGHADDLFAGQPSIDIRTMDEPVIDGDAAQVDIAGRVQTGLHHLHLDLVRSGDRWLVDTLVLDASPPLDLPAGVDVVEVAVTEYSFTFDAAALESGRFAMHVTNNGALSHELVIKRVDTDASLPEPLGPGQYAIPVAGVSAIEPGATANVVLAEQLPPGHYFIFCEVFDDDGNSTHLEHGMAAEFTVVASD